MPSPTTTETKTKIKTNSSTSTSTSISSSSPSVFHPQPFLESLYDGIQHRSFHSIPLRRRRASVVAVFRIRPLPQHNHPPLDPRAPSVAPRPHESINSFLNRFFKEKWVQSGILEMLFILRAINPRDRWSGHVAFPGGRQNRGEKDVETAMREVNEETGIDLSNESNYICLGKMNDRFVRKSLVVCPFVFLQTCPPSHIDMHVQESEVETFKWVPVEHIVHAPSPFCHRISYRIAQYIPAFRYIPSTFRKLLQIEEVEFPTITLKSIHELRSDLISDDTYDKYFNDHCPKTERPFHLWGLTLSIVMDIIHLAGHPKPFYSAIQIPNPLFNTLLNHGKRWMSKWEVRQALYREAKLLEDNNNNNNTSNNYNNNVNNNNNNENKYNSKTKKLNSTTSLPSVISMSVIFKLLLLGSIFIAALIAMALWLFSSSSSSSSQDGYKSFYSQSRL